MREIRSLRLVALLFPTLAWGQSAQFNLSQFSHYVIPGGNGISTNWLVNNQATYGNFNTAVGCSNVTNSNHPAQVMGSTPSGLAGLSYKTYDSVGCFFDNTALAPAAFSVGTYTTTTFTPTTPYTGGQLALMFNGMWVSTCSSNTSPCPDTNFFRGQVTSFSANSIIVSGWFQQGNSAAGQNPSSSYCTNGSTCYAVVNPVTKIWALNANTLLNSSSYAQQATGFELGVQDNSPTAGTNLTWGYDSVNLTPNEADSAFIARNFWRYAFHAKGAGEGSLDPASGFYSTQLTGNVLQDTSTMTSGFLIRSIYFNVNYLGQTDLGSFTTPAVAPIYFHSSGHATGDAQLTASGGTGNNDGTLTLTAGSLVLHSATGTQLSVDNLELIASQAALGNGLYNGTAGNEVDVSVGASKVAAFTSTGLNGAAIGATTTSTGAFTTLNASGAITGTAGATIDGTVCLGAVSACGNEALRATSLASAVNQVRVVGAITGAAPSVLAAGADASVNLIIGGKGANGTIQAQTAIVSTGSTFSVSGCGSSTGLTGGEFAGKFTCGTGAAPATLTITAGGAGTAVNGYNCIVQDTTTNTVIPMTTGGTTQTCVVKGNITTSDVVTVIMIGY